MFDLSLNIASGVFAMSVEKRDKYKRLTALTSDNGYRPQISRHLFSAGVLS